MFFFFLISYRRLAYIESIIRSSWRSHDAEQKLTFAWFQDDVAIARQHEHGYDLQGQATASQ